MAGLAWCGRVLCSVPVKCAKIDRGTICLFSSSRNIITTCVPPAAARINSEVAVNDLGCVLSKVCEKMAKVI